MGNRLSKIATRTGDAGTTGLGAHRLGRHYVGVDLKNEYLAMSAARIMDDAPLLLD
ncbi:MAG: ATP:cob(I)alamin adenosyltransferase, partial [Pseudomonadota bacterium]